MTALILPFLIPGPANPTPLACFTRVGEAHRKLSELHAAGHLPAKRAVIDASRLKHQRELVAGLRESGTQIVLDTEAAELASPARCGGHVRHAPWALDGGGVLGPAGFQGSALDRFVGHVARHAVENRIDTVLAPSHFLGDPTFGDWLAVDRAACVALRRALDLEGGADIAIDYSVILSNTMLSDPTARGQIMAALEDLPIENVWVRSSGFGAEAGPLAAKRYLTAMSSLHNLGKPVIADHLGGLVGEAALAFGAVSGIARGISDRERFDARDWHKAPSQDDNEVGFGRATRLVIPDLHRSLTLREIDVLSSAKGGRRLCGCGDRGCCRDGYSTMISDHRGHAARQLFRSIAAIESVPDRLREQAFLDGTMSNANRKGRDVKALRPSTTEAIRHGINLDALMKRMAEQSRKLEKFGASLEHLHESRGETGARAHPVRPFPASNAKSSQNRS